MEMKGLKEKIEDEKRKLEHSKLVETRPSKLALEELAQDSPR